MKKLILIIMIILIPLMAGCGSIGHPIDPVVSQDILPGSAHHYSLGSQKYPYKEAWIDDVHVTGHSLWVDGKENPWEDIATGNVTIISGNMTLPINESDVAGLVTDLASKENPLTFQDSLDRTGDTIKLVGDNATPGNSQYYGTDAGGTKGFYTLPAAGGDMAKATYDTDADNIVDKAETVDDGSGNVSTAAQVKATVANSHTHSNMAVLNNIQEALTTVLKNSYDWLVTNITAAWKTTVDNFMASKAAASGLASLDASSKVAQDPANATDTPTASKIPIADASGKLDSWLSDYPVVYGRVTGSNDTNTTSTLHDIAGLSVALGINSVYEFESVLSVSTSADTNGCEYGVNYSVAGGAVEAQCVGSRTSTTSTTERISALNTPTGLFMTTASQNGGVIIKGIITTGANAGNLTIKHKKIASGTSTVFINSFLRVRRVS